ncbi:hypothetical protein BP00DRAFT_279087 [Aspergillus indologenus CBS 114.80]|uniref:BTB domain-containing protein n=1 Tax=Aspergillus indologenus CBS 114.80 TaxID=1450541 RepID=A0A2V5HVF6_9EURO|nr:hypothetical protein BP00DRAFT_279087 [Aspergillus indologenus CBS 114.80]
MSSANPNPAASLHGMTKSGEYCDLCLICDNGSVQAHKAVVCSQVPIIAAECAENNVIGSYACDGFDILSWQGGRNLRCAASPVRVMWRRCLHALLE